MFPIVIEQSVYSTHVYRDIVSNLLAEISCKLFTRFGRTARAWLDDGNLAIFKMFSFDILARINVEELVVYHFY